MPSAGAASRISKLFAAVVLLCILLLLNRSLPVSVNDFAAYWSAGRLLLQHSNPYAAGPVRAIEQSLGRPDAEHLIMLNPPWALPLALPVALLPFRIAQTLWLWASILFTLFCVRLLWELYSGMQQVSPWLWLLIALFLPMYVQFAIGQMGAIVLLGITGFLYAQHKNNDALAGLSLFLVALKPQLSFLLWLCLAFWIVRKKRWKIAGIFAAAMSLAIAIAFLLDANVFQHYFKMWHATRVIWGETPTLGGIICFFFHGDRNMALIPFYLATAWGVFHWKKHGQNWDWLSQTPLLLLVSVTASPYSWFFDQIVFIPAIVQLTANARPSSFRKWRWGVFVYAGINLGIFLFTEIKILPLSGPWFAWIAPAWLVLYAVIRGKERPVSREIVVSS